MANEKLNIDELCALADVPVRTVRFYIQKGLVDRPEGERRFAFYTSQHLEQLLTIKKWVAAGLSLERIGELMTDATPELPPLRRRSGDLRVQSHLYVDEGVEIVLDPGLAGLSPEQVRAFANGIMALYEQIKSSNAE